MVFQWDDYVALKILKIKAEIRDANKKIGRKVKSKSVDERGDCTSGISEMDAVVGADAS